MVEQTYKTLSNFIKTLGGYSFVSGAYQTGETNVKVASMDFLKGETVTLQNEIQATDDYFTIHGLVKNYDTNLNGGNFDNPYRSYNTFMFIDHLRELQERGFGSMNNYKDSLVPSRSLAGAIIEGLDREEINNDLAIEGKQYLNDEIALEAWDFFVTTGKPIKKETLSIAGLELLKVKIEDDINGTIRLLYVKGGISKTNLLLEIAINLAKKKRITLETGDKAKTNINLTKTELDKLLMLVGEGLLSKPTGVAFNYTGNLNSYFVGRILSEFIKLSKVDDIYDPTVDKKTKNNVWHLLFESERLSFDIKDIKSATVSLVASDTTINENDNDSNSDNKSNHTLTSTQSVYAISFVLKNSVEVSLTL